MKNVKVLLRIGFVLFMLSACSKEDNQTETYENRIVTFTASASGECPTRASDALWDVDDEIGVFMKTAGQPLNASSILSDAAGNRYVTRDKVTFGPFEDSEAIYYPDDGTAVDFIAYYPYQSGLLSFIYKVDVSNQASQEAIDLLYSDNAKNETNVSHLSDLSFSHKLTRVKMMVKAGKGITTLDGLEVTISGVSTTADFNLADGNLTVTDLPDKTVAFNMSGTSATEKTAQAILIPADGTTERTLYFKLPSGKVFKHTLTAMALESGRRYTFDATLNDESAVVDPTVGYIETPVMTNLSSTQQYVIHMLPGDEENRNFAMLYDNAERLALWVAYPLVSSYHLGQSGRTDKWAYDPLIDQNYQPNLYKGFPAADTDRGHQIPSGDRTCTDGANNQTFYYSNMTAQQSQMNQGIWATLEGRVRTWAESCDTMYVVTGAMIRTTTDNQVEYTYCNSNRQVARPKAYFKALAQRTGDTYTTCAFLIDNAAPASGDSWANHKLTVKELETETGYTFFPLIEESYKDHIEANKWN